MHQFLSMITVPWVFWSVTAVIGSFGVMALFFPDRFANVARQSATWVDTSRVFSLLDRRVELDGPVLRHTRAFGMFLLTGLAVFVSLIVLR